MDPMNRSTYAFCHGERGAVSTSRMSIALAVVAHAWNAASRSLTRYRDASFQGNASRSCWAVHAAVGRSVRPNGRHGGAHGPELPVRTTGDRSRLARRRSPPLRFAPHDSGGMSATFVTAVGDAGPCTSSRLPETR